MRDLLAGFVHEGWVSQLDYGSLEKVDPGYVDRALSLRTNDLLWRVKWSDGIVYIYLMLEFQSTVDPYMAVRMLTYIGLLYEGLIRTKQLPDEGRLPPVLPIVLYNGSAKWHAELELSALMSTGPAALCPYRPQSRYLLIDEARYREEELSSMRNLVADLFRLENSREAVQISRVLAALGEWLRSPEYENLRRDCGDWARSTILRKLPSFPADAVNDILEMQSMLDNLEIEWKAQWKAEGLAEGRERGIAEGRVEGRVAGRREGQAALLLRLMQQRFHTVPQEVRLHVETASEEQLYDWSARLLTAESIEGLLHDDV